jgi:acid phosphatase
MTKTRKLLFLLLISTVLWVRAFAQNPLIVNLSDAKSAVKNYYDSGQFSVEMDSIITEAMRTVAQIPVQKNSAFVFDVDETALSNLEYEIKYDFGYLPEKWNRWISDANAPAIPQVKKFYDFLLSRGYRIIFITGRSCDYREPTYRNLVSAGYTTFDTLICRSPAEQNISAKEYKTSKRRALTEQGYSIVGSIGDQWSDLEGGYVILKIKIPN